MIALLAGAALQEHNSPGPAALIVLRGRARLAAGDDVVELDRLGYAPIPPCRHRLDAVTDTVVLLSVGVGSGTLAG